MIPLGLCQCGCGRNTKVSDRTHRNRGHIKGQFLKFFDSHNNGAIKHGHSHKGNHSTEYIAWRSMLTRCYCPNTLHFARYGGRGIQVCERWRNSFEAFLEDVGYKPAPDLTLDRWPDNDGNYEPGNVRWATWKQQGNNRNPKKRRQ